MKTKASEKKMALVSKLENMLKTSSGKLRIYAELENGKVLTGWHNTHDNDRLAILGAPSSKWENIEDIYQK